MDSFKKISCIVSAVFIIVVSVILPAFAAEEDLVELFFSTYGYASYSANTVQGTISNVSSGRINSLPSGFYSSSNSANGYGPTDYYLSFSGAMADSNNQTFYAVSGYTYVGSFDISFRAQNLGNSSAPQSAWKAPDVEQMFFAVGYNPYSTGNSHSITADDYGLEVTTSLVSADGLVNGMLVFSFRYSFVFRVPSDVELASNLPWLSMEFHWDRDSYNGTYNELSPPTLTPNLKFVSVEAQYDPTGEYYDDSVDKIVQGQMEAAQYQLDQERESVQADLDDAMDQDTSGLDISNLFGSSLVSLYNSITYTGTSFDFKLPASGTVPLLNTQLWPETSIPIKEYIDKVPSAVWVVLNFLLWFLVVRSIIKLVHKLLDMINGDSGGGD